MYSEISFRENRVDYLLAITAMIQPVLVLVQLFLQNVLGFSPEDANRIRVAWTAIPILVSMIFVVGRKPKLVIGTYLIAFTVLAVTEVAFPGRWAVMKSEILRLTLSVVLPIGLCAASVRNMHVMIRCMKWISYLAAIIGLLYVGLNFIGYFTLDHYSMTFSYALLFPTLLLFSREKVFYKIVAVFLMIGMLAIGSRGALLLSIVFCLILSLWERLTVVRVVVLSILVLAFYFFLFDVVVQLFADFFDSIGISSRTMRMLMNDELVENDSGREYIYSKTWELIAQRPVFGSGIWSDRLTLGDESYCHNIILELLADFGYVGAIIIGAIFITNQFRTFIRIPKYHKTIYLMLVGIICPLFVSSSYLISYNLSLFLGFSYFLSQVNKRDQYQELAYK